jgi:hypothetical protein
MSELAGCLKSDAAPMDRELPGESARAALARHERIARQKS